MAFKIIILIFNYDRSSKQQQKVWKDDQSSIKVSVYLKTVTYDKQSNSI